MIIIIWYKFCKAITKYERSCHNFAIINWTLSEEELAGSYNWDYLLDWGPQYQPLAHVFKEISKLRDDEDDGSTGTDTAMSGNNNLRIAPQSSVAFMRYINITNSYNLKKRWLIKIMSFIV